MIPKLWLIGMMSSGKTKVGRKVSKHSGYPLLDTDDEIVKRAGMTIPQIFAERGLTRFGGRAGVPPLWEVRGQGAGFV